MLPRLLLSISLPQLSARLEDTLSMVLVGNPSIYNHAHSRCLLVHLGCDKCHALGALQTAEISFSHSGGWRARIKALGMWCLPWVLTLVI